MDFITAVSRTARVTINGTGYDVPRFLLPEFEQWAAAREKADIDRAVSRIPDPDKQAQFLLFYSPPPIDVAILADEARSPSGIKYVVNFCLERAGVPEDVRTALLVNGNPMQLRKLAEILLSASEGAAAIRDESGDPGKRGDPLPVRALTSAGEPGITPLTAADSTPPTTPTQAA